MKLELKKEPDNKFDKEAIVVKKKGLGEIGYVANSAHTVIGESMSAGRIYDKNGDTAKAKVVLVTPNGTICSLSKKKVTYEEERYFLCKELRAFGLWRFAQRITRRK